MYLPPEFEPRKRHVLLRDDYEDSPGHVELTARLCKSLYYGRNPTTDRPSLPVTEMCVEFFQEAAPRGLGKVDPFFASSVGRKSCISPCSMMLGMIYIDRLKKRNNEYLKTVSSSDLFLISMMVASKYLYDEGVDEEVFNDEWAESATMETDDVNEAEIDFLAAIDWSLFVNPAEFQEMLNRVEKGIALNQGFDRGWFSYMDLYVLTEDCKLGHAIHTLLLEISKVFVICSVAYFASVATLLMAPVTLTLVRSSLPALPQTPAINVPDPRPSVVDNGFILGDSTITIDDVEIAQIENETTMQTSEDLWKKNHSNVEGVSKMKNRLTLHGLMTLAFIKDTVNTIFGNIVGKSKTKQTGMEADQLEFSDRASVTMSCNPGLCDDRNVPSANCYNFSSVEDYENWCLACLKMFTHNSEQNSKQGQRSRSGQETQWSSRLRSHCSEGFSCSQLLLPGFPQCCCVHNSYVLSPDVSGQILYQPFSDVVLGFGTTVKPV